MTDFLSRLADRALGLSPRVQPLLAPHFAPRALALPDPPADLPAHEPELPPDLSRHSTPPGGETVSRPTPIVAPATPTAEYGAAAVDPLSIEPLRIEPLSSDPLRFQQLPVDAQTMTSRDTHSEATEPHSQPSNEPVQFRQPRSRARPVSEITSTIVPSERQTTATNALTSAPAESRGSPPAVMPRHRDSSPPRAPRQSDRDHEEVEPVTPRLTPQRTAAERVAVPLPTVLPPDEPHLSSLSPPRPDHVKATSGVAHGPSRPVAELVLPRTETVRPQSAVGSGQASSVPPAPDASPPAIRITIGRLEVRAIVPPPPAKNRSAPARTAPRVTLDEYLKQNRGEPR